MCMSPQINNLKIRFALSQFWVEIMGKSDLFIIGNLFELEQNLCVLCKKVHLFKM